MMLVFPLIVCGSHCPAIMTLFSLLGLLAWPLRRHSSVPVKYRSTSLQGLFRAVDLVHPYILSVENCNGWKFIVARNNHVEGGCKLQYTFQGGH